MAPMWSASWEAPHRTHLACWGCMDKAYAVTRRPRERLDPPVVGGTGASASEVEGWPGFILGGAALHSKWGKNPMWHPVSRSPPPARVGCGHSQGWPVVGTSRGAEAGTEWILSEVFSLKTILSDFGSIAFCQKPTMIPRTLYKHSKHPWSDWTWSPAQTQVSSALSPTGWPHRPTSLAWLSSAKTPRTVERQVWPQAEGPSMGSKPSGRPSSHCHWAARSWGMLCFFAFCCDGAPQLSWGDWEVCWCYMLPP